MHFQKSLAPARQPESLVPAVTRAIHAEDKDLPLQEVATLDSIIAAMLSQ